ncbi:hypothetical protein KSP40_PGU016584 [Platanthera guangdongensis]|uniref:Uncharacterized protein n=1 Tax=Platanthera guangdongensis TaxID=2320717 RepID=A0ABR2ML86_9ASPA
MNKREKNEIVLFQRQPLGFQITMPRLSNAGFRNTSSQISASATTNGKHIVCASEDSHVYIWKHNADSQSSRRSKSSISITQSYEHFPCPGVTAAIPWPSARNSMPGAENQNRRGCLESPGHPILDSNHNLFSDRASVTWPEEKLLVSSAQNTPRRGTDVKNGGIHLPGGDSAWGMVIVAAGRGGQIKTFQNFGFPLKNVADLFNEGKGFRGLMGSKLIPHEEEERCFIP